MTTQVKDRCSLCGGKGWVLKVKLGNVFEKIPCPKCKEK